MDSDPLATAIGRWADGLAPAARDQLSTYDIRALYDRLARTGADDGGPAAYDGWVEELGPATRSALSRYDREALIAALASRGPRTDPVAVSRPQRCANCGSTAMVRTGACITCQDCGTTTGCG
ncbi:MAG: hypothetical protein AAF602_23580 [Myxococcota bacterium]